MTVPLIERATQIGPYVVLDEIGAGGMGVVLKARHRTLDRLVALKVLPPAAVNSADAVERFQREMKAAAKLSHPNIVTTHDGGEYQGTHYLVMELVEGQDLAAISKERGPLPWDEAIGYILQAARGLQYAHDEGIVHRDIKPANLLRDKKGTIKILDLGLARMRTTAADDRLTMTGAVMGTCDYMAPEQALDTHTADARSDIYSLGCTLYRLLTGTSPYKGNSVLATLLAHREASIPSLLAARLDVPKELDAVFRKMVAKDPADRHQSMTEVIGALEPILADRGRAASSPTISLAGLDRSNKSRNWWAASARLPRAWKLALGTALLGLVALLAIVVAPQWRAGAVVVDSTDPVFADEILDASSPAESPLVRETAAIERRPIFVPRIDPEPKAWDFRPGEPLASRALVPSPAPIRGLRSWTIETIGVRGNLLPAVYSPDGRLVLTGSMDGAVRIWDAATHRLVRVLEARSNNDGFTLSPDGRYLAMYGEWQTLDLWEVATGRLLRSVPIQDHYAFAWSPDGGKLGYLKHGWELLLRDFTALETVRSIPVPFIQLGILAWSPDGSRIALVNVDRGAGTPGVSIRNPDGEEKHAFPIEHCCFQVAWDPTGTRLLGWQWDPDECSLWDVPEGKRLSTIQLPARLSQAAWLPDGKRLALSDRNDIVLWDLTKRAVAARAPHGMNIWRGGIACAPDGKSLTLAGSIEDMTLASLELSTMHKETWRSGITVRDASQISPDGRWLAECRWTSPKTLIRLWPLDPPLASANIGNGGLALCLPALVGERFSLCDLSG